MKSLLAYILDAVFRLMPIQSDIFTERAKNASRRPPAIPKGVIVGGTEYGGVLCETVEKKGNSNTLLYIHGGGFTTGSARERRAVTYYLCDKLGYNVIACDYRLAPENRLPSAYDDCFAVYKELSIGLPRLYVAGESAGATIAIAVVQRAIRENLPLPTAVAAYSPIAAIGKDFPSHRSNLKTDYMLKRDPTCKELLNMICPEGAGKEFYENREISPYYGSFEGFPPLYLSVSDSEILFDDAKALYEKATNSGADCKFEIRKGLIHAWPVITQLKEARRTLADTKKFFERAGL